MLKRKLPLLALSVLFFGDAASAQQFPILDEIAQKVIDKYQSMTCEQLWESKGKPKSQREQEAIDILKGNPEMQQAFFNKVAGPIVTKMFQCGMIP
jgi:hypothetical protein